MSQSDNIYHFRTISEYCAFNRQETLHPLMSTVDLALAAPRRLRPMRFDFYLIFLKEIKCGDLRYGCHQYDYEEGTLVFVSPGQLIGSHGEETYQPQGRALAFHPDFLSGTPLGGGRMDDFTFFGYQANEALHMSARERALVAGCLDQIGEEFGHIDKHTKRLVVGHLELLLGYCERFYDRQFITRQQVNQGVLTKFEGLLAEYFRTGRARGEGLPTVAHFAERLHLSANYFGDLVKKDTGLSPQDHIQLKVLDVAREGLLDPQNSVSEVAYDLGFAYPQHFSRMFKRATGVTPGEYRNQTN